MPLRRKNLAPPPHEPGAPPRPEGKKRAFRDAWNALTKEFAGRLFQDDGPMLEELIQCRADQYKGAGDRREQGRKRAAELLAKIDKRTLIEPVPAAVPENGLLPGADLDSFLAAVRQERASFASRLQPVATICLEAVGQSFLWPEGHPATIARDYALQATQGSLVVCDLTRRAAARHLADLENGYQRGIFFDPQAAANIVTWFQDFIGLKLEPWEIFLTTSLFAFKRATGMRRFSEAWISVAKKNGKSAIAAGIGLWGLVCDQERFAEVYSAATAKDQARIVYRDAVRAVHFCPALLEYIREFKTGSLTVEATDSRFEPLSSDVKSMEGLRPSTVVCDEVHVWDNRSAWDSLTKGVVSRSQPLIFAITTAGESRNTFAGGKYGLAEKILTGVFQQDDTFVLIFELDKADHFADESCWPKANPNLGISLQPEGLRKILAEALEDPSGQAAFERYHCNRWVTYRQGRSIPSDKWDLCGVPNVSAQDLRQQFLAEHGSEPTWMGLDLGQINDWSCLSCLYWDGYGGITVLPYFWVPEYGLPERERLLGVPISQWVRAGFVKLIEGDLADPRIIKQDILSMIANGKVNKLSYDPWQSRVLCAEIAEESHIACVAVKQNFSELTAPCRAFKEAIWSKTLAHLNNPVARWMSGNVVLEPEDPHGGIRPKKLSPNEKIDFVSATVTALHGFLAAGSELDSIALFNQRWGGDNPAPIPLI